MKRPKLIRAEYRVLEATAAIAEAVSALPIEVPLPGLKPVRLTPLQKRNAWRQYVRAGRRSAEEIKR